MNCFCLKVQSHLPLLDEIQISVKSTQSGISCEGERFPYADSLWFEQDFCVSCSSYIATLLAIDLFFFPWNFANVTAPLVYVLHVLVVRRWGEKATILLSGTTVSVFFSVHFQQSLSNSGSACDPGHCHVLFMEQQVKSYSRAYGRSYGFI